MLLRRLLALNGNLPYTCEPVPCPNLMLVQKLCQVLCGGLCWLLRTCPFYCSVLNLCQLCCSMYFGSMMMCWTYVSSIALCAMVSVLLWWKMRKQWRFFVNILWWKLPCSVTKINIPYGLQRAAKLCRHVARIWWRHVAWQQWSTR